MFPLVSRTGSPAPSGQDRLPQIQAGPVHANFNATHLGDPSALQILFPENGIPLTRHALPADGFRSGFLHLSPLEQQSIDLWLEHGLLPENRFGLSSALCQLPGQNGDFLRTDQFLTPDEIPWGGKIRVGDVITGYPDFVSASSHDAYARECVSELARLTRPHAVAFCKFASTSAARPILPMPVLPECEYTVLFPCHTCFEVRGMAFAEACGSTTFPSMRIGILLEECPLSWPVKHMHTGQRLSPQQFWA